MRWGRRFDMLNKGTAWNLKVDKLTPPNTLLNKGTAWNLKVDKLTLNTLYATKNCLYFLIVWYLRGLKSMSILICLSSKFVIIYLKTHVSLSEIGQKYSIFLGDIYQVQRRPSKTPVDLMFWYTRKHKDIKSSSTYNLSLPHWPQTFGDFACVKAELCKLLFWAYHYHS